MDHHVLAEPTAHSEGRHLFILGRLDIVVQLGAAIVCFLLEIILLWLSLLWETLGTTKAKHSLCGAIVQWRLVCMRSNYAFHLSLNAYWSTLFISL